MPKETPAAKVVGAIATGPQKFYIQKKWIQPMLVAMQGSPGNPPYSAATAGLKDRSDVSGKFARKVGQNRRALEKAFEMIGDERQALVKHHAEKFPELEIVDGVERPHPQAGNTTPVYQTDQQGRPMFKKDKAGNDTDERVSLPDQYNLADPVAFQRDLKQMMEEWTVIECPGFTSDDFNSFKTIEPRIIDPLMDLEVDAPTTASPAEQIAALHATGESFVSLAGKMQTALDEKGDDAPESEASTDEDEAKGGRSAP